MCIRDSFLSVRRALLGEGDGLDAPLESQLRREEPVG